MLVQRLCHNSNFLLFSTAMKILMNETQTEQLAKNVDIVFMIKVCFFHDILVST